ncbi:hypothetical protein F5X99DRAFT_396748 [Biscogniauxia marginata]|nr:hypothetical protein F5X99DRAFT_396748 [Biscogniauxia marginata]
MACDAQNWCCTSDGNSCCSHNNTVILDQGVGTAVRQVPFVTAVSSSSSTSSLPTSSTSSDASTSTAPSESGNGPSTTGLVTGLAVVSTALIVSLMAIGFLIQRLRKLKRDVATSPRYVPSYNNTPTSPDSSPMGEVARQKIISEYSPQAPTTQTSQTRHELYGQQDPREIQSILPSLKNAEKKEKA